MSVYKLTGILLDLQSHADDIDPTTFKDTADSIKFNLDSEYDDGLDFTTNIESDIDGIDKEIKKLRDRKKAMKNSVSYIRNIIAKSINASGRKKVKTAKHTISVPGSYKAKAIFNKDTIPASYYDTKMVLSESRVKRDLMSGKEVGDGKLQYTLNITVR